MRYVICSTGRARSSVLMRYLKQLGAGLADVWTNPWFYSEFEVGNFEALCKFVGSRNVDGHVGLRMTWKGLVQVCRMYQTEAMPFFHTALPDAKFIYFERDNLAQVVESIYYEQVQMFDDVPTFLPHKAIETALIECAEEGTSWEMFFSRHGIQPYRLTYEDLISDRNSVCLDVLKFLGIPPPKSITLHEKKNPNDLTLNPAVRDWYNGFMQRYIDIIRK